MESGLRFRLVLFGRKGGGLCVEFGLTRESLDDEEGQRDKASISRSAGMSSSIGC
jgi:hypothetical protein